MAFKPIKRFPRVPSAQLLSVPDYLKSWIADGGSLTQRLIKDSGGDFEVRLLSERCQRVSLHESIKLQIDQDQLAWVRKVQLLSRGKVAVTAKTVVPVSQLTGDWRKLLMLKNRSLGDFLFAHPNLERHHLSVVKRCLGGCFCWGRCSLFKVGNHRLLLTELFHEAYFECH